MENLIREHEIEIDCAECGIDIVITKDEHESGVELCDKCDPVAYETEKADYMLDQRKGERVEASHE